MSIHFYDDIPEMVVTGTLITGNRLLPLGTNSLKSSFRDIVSKYPYTFGASATLRAIRRICAICGMNTETSPLAGIDWRGEPTFPHNTGFRQAAAKAGARQSSLCDAQGRVHLGRKDCDSQRGFQMDHRTRRARPRPPAEGGSRRNFGGHRNGYRG